MKLFLIGLILAIGLSVGGCATNTFQDKLALGYATNAEVRNTTAALVHGKVLGSKEGQAVQELANNARGTLDLAKQANDSALLNMAYDVLNRMKSFVNEKVGK